MLISRMTPCALSLVRDVDHPKKVPSKGECSEQRRLKVSLCSAKIALRKNGGMQAGEKMGSYKEKELEVISFPLLE